MNKFSDRVANARMRISDSRAFLKRIWPILHPYWHSDEWRAASGLLISVLGLNLGLVFVSVKLNAWNKTFYNSLEQRDFDAFKWQLVVFAGLAFAHIIVAVYRFYLLQMLEFRWRQWLTKRFIGTWLANQTYYRLELLKTFGERTQAGTSSTRPMDNPDQRIAEDLQLFTTKTLNLTLGFISAVVSFCSFVVILWGLSGPISFALFGQPVTIQGYMVWVAVGYAFCGSLLTHLIGRPLMRLNFEQQQREANFRFSLVRARENAEGIALYSGEETEHGTLLNLFQQVRNNWWALIGIQKRLIWFASFYGQISIIFPILVAAPRYFAKAISLGELMQISSAFNRVQDAMNWFIDSYFDIAIWKASCERLADFLVTAEGVHTLGVNGIQRTTKTSAVQSDNISTADLSLNLPSGQALVSDLSLSIEKGSRVLISGPSGAGKTTLFRALAGIWPFGSGSVNLPKDEDVLFLPQKPYLPLGSLRAVVAYPSPPERFTDVELKEILAATGLPQLTGQLDDVGQWSIRLSPGEQQRLAIARALLHKPGWLFLDEATSALDEAMESRMYQLLTERLKTSTIISIAHRPSVAQFHTRTISIAQAS